MTARKRKALSKKLRFEIFKRDCFRCQYCGQSPPVVTLEIDHVVPVSEGGGNDDVNLLAACFECNRGKAARSLKAVPASVVANVKEQRERAQQLEEYNRFLIASRKAVQDAVEEIGAYWYDRIQGPEAEDRFEFGRRRARSIKRFLKDLPKAEILDAVNVAQDRHPPRSVDDDYRCFRYFCGVCWEKIRRAQAFVDERVGASSGGMTSSDAR